MFKKIFAPCALVACAAFFTGCGGASSAMDKAKEAGKEGIDKAKEAGKEGADKVKEGIAKMKSEVDGAVKLEDFQTKINSLSGESKTQAMSIFENLKKAYEEFKANPNLELKDKVMKLVADLKAKLNL